MLYWSVFILLLFFSVKEVVQKRINSRMFNILWLILVLMVCMRQGQGSDYYNYELIYNHAERNINNYLNLFTENDFGFLFINYVAIKLGLTYKVFISLFSLLSMICLYPFFLRICNKSILALFIFYTSSFYLTYIFSAVRQGFVMAFFLGFVYHFIEKKKYFLYYFFILLLSTIHLSALVLLILPPLINIGICPLFSTSAVLLYLPSAV